uniref:C3H1-type domain-containing protein n=1 Tax=Leishmania guyanensis TaxID=5670 RepID=A0A1E1IMZ0_LEIGU|nr:hypothetical protein, conserved [Leishmania guyanensis]
MKRGGSGEQDNVARLKARGFGKAKATQALKDAGNNVDVALRILERQRDQQKQQPRVCTSTSTASAAIPSLHRTKPPPTSSLFGSSSPAAEALRRQRARRHPCVVQFGSCQFGQYCALRGLPGDICVQHFQGCCVYGSACHHHHTIDGVDVRDYVWGSPKDEDLAPVLRSGDSMYRVHAVAGMGSKVQTAELIGDQADTPTRDGDGEYDGGDVVHRSPAASLGMGSDFNRIRGSVPSHTDPMLPPLLCTFERKVEETGGSEEVDAAGARTVGLGPEAVAVAHPTPFRDLVKGCASAVQPSLPPQPPISSSTLSSSAATAAARRGRARHPCIAQFGNCKFGDACVHADRDADVCVHFLNRRCRYSADECRYRHETEEEYQATLLARIGLPGSTADVAGERRESPYADKSKCRLQGSRPQTTATPGPARDKSSTGGQSLSLALPSVEDLAALPEALRPTDDAGAAHKSDDDYLSSASEMQVFLGLLEAFPNVEPVVVLQALRASGGDLIHASDIISHFGDAPTVAEVSNVASVLALAAAEEAEEREAAVVLERQNALLTLLSLFPAVEPAAVEAVLSQHHGAFEEAYSVLLCAQENVTRSAIWSGSTATMAPVDQLRVEKLCVMFPSLDTEVVRSAYCAADRQWSRATAALNALTEELLSLDSVAAAAAAPANNSDSGVAAASSCNDKGRGGRGRRQQRQWCAYGGGGNECRGLQRLSGSGERDTRVWRLAAGAGAGLPGEQTASPCPGPGHRRFFKRGRQNGEDTQQRGPSTRSRVQPTEPLGDARPGAGAAAHKSHQYPRPPWFPCHGGARRAGPSHPRLPAPSYWPTSHRDGAGEAQQARPSIAIPCRHGGPPH